MPAAELGNNAQSRRRKLLAEVATLVTPETLLPFVVHKEIPGRKGIFLSLILHAAPKNAFGRCDRMRQPLEQGV